MAHGYRLLEWRSSSLVPKAHSGPYESKAILRDRWTLEVLNGSSALERGAEPEKIRSSAQHGARSRCREEETSDEMHEFNMVKNDHRASNISSQNSYMNLLL